MSKDNPRTREYKNQNKASLGYVSRQHNVIMTDNWILRSSFFLILNFIEVPLLNYMTFFFLFATDNLIKMFLQMMQYRMKIFEEYKRNNTQNFYN